MTPEQELELLDMKDRLLDSINQIDQMICGGAGVHHDAADDGVENIVLPDDDDFDEEDPDDEDEELEELGVTGMVDPGDVGRKRGIEYRLRDRTTAYKERA